MYWNELDANYTIRIRQELRVGVIFILSSYIYIRLSLVAGVFLCNWGGFLPSLANYVKKGVFSCQ